MAHGPESPAGGQPQSQALDHTLAALKLCRDALARFRREWTSSDAAADRAAIAAADAVLAAPVVPGNCLLCGLRAAGHKVAVNAEHSEQCAERRPPVVPAEGAPPTCQHGYTSTLCGRCPAPPPVDPHAPESEPRRVIVVESALIRDARDALFTVRDTLLRPGAAPYEVEYARYLSGLVARLSDVLASPEAPATGGEK